MYVIVRTLVIYLCIYLRISFLSISDTGSSGIALIYFKVNKFSNLSLLLNLVTLVIYVPKRVVISITNFHPSL